VPQPHGGALIPGAGGGPQPGSGRPKKAFKKFLAELREDPDAQDALAKAAKDPDKRAFSAAWGVITDYDESKPGKKLEHRFPQLPKEQAANRIATILQEAVARKSSNGNGNGTHTNGNGNHP
jgi:hypothetical protein